MGLFDNKSWMAQELYNEYLELKTDISERVKNLEVVKQFDTITPEGIKFKEDKIKEKVERLKVVLKELNVMHGIALEDLILLSIGVNV